MRRTDGRSGGHARTHESTHETTCSEWWGGGGGAQFAFDSARRPSTHEPNECEATRTPSERAGSPSPHQTTPTGPLTGSDCATLRGRRLSWPTPWRSWTERLTERSPRWDNQDRCQDLSQDRLTRHLSDLPPEPRPVQRRLVSCQVRVPNLPLPDLRPSAPGSRTFTARSASTPRSGSTSNTRPNR